MNIEKLKENILNKTNIPDFIIFLYKDNDFLSLQYTEAISNIKELPIEYLNSLEELGNQNNYLTSNIESNLKVYKCLELNSEAPLNKINNLIIITSSLNKNIKDKFLDYIIEIPSLERWQIEDYANVLGEGIEDKDIKFLIESSNYNIFEISNELNKLKYYSPTQRRFIFKQSIQEGLLDYIYSYNIFNLIDSIQNKDVDRIFNILKRSSIDALPLINLLCQSFRSLILVWLNKDPSPYNTGLKSNQIWAIKNIPHNYSKEQLIDIYCFLTDLDYKIKTGQLPNKNSFLVDFIITRILSF